MIRWLLILAAVVCPAAAQSPKIGDINFYGLRKLAPDKILSALELKSGDPLPPSKGDLEDRLELISGVAAARVEAVCCEGNTASLFVGIEEKGAPQILGSGLGILLVVGQDAPDSRHGAVVAITRGGCHVGNEQVGMPVVVDVAEVGAH